MWRPVESMLWGGEEQMADFPLLLVVDSHTLWVDPAPAVRKATYVRCLNQRVGLSSLALGCRSFSSISCLRHVRIQVLSSDIGLPWKGLVGLCLLLYRFGNT